jgi:hypothetical protein
MYQLRLHKTLTVEKWSRYPREQQVMMIANELNRAKNWIDKNSVMEVNSSYERALELTDLTTADSNWPRNAKKEIEMLAAQYVATQKDARVNIQLYNLLLQIVPEAWNMLYG